MSVPAPTTYDPLTAADLAPQAIKGATIDRILSNLNYLYRYHSPAVWNIAPRGASYGSAVSWVFAAQPSADDLTYRARAALQATSGDTVTVTVEGSTSSAGPWNTISTVTVTAPSSPWWQDVGSGAVLGTWGYFRVTFSASTWGRIDSIALYPDAPVALPSTDALTAAGFRRYDDAQLGSAGAAVTVEHANRAWQGASAVLRDRRHCLLSMVTDGTPAWTKRSGVSALTMLVGQVLLPGQAESAATVRYRLDDTGGTGTARLSQDGAGAVDLVADGTDRTASLVLVGPRPVVRVVCEPAGTLTAPYILIDWAPGE